MNHTMHFGYDDLFTNTEVLGNNLKRIEIEIRSVSKETLEKMTEHQIVNKIVHDQNKIEPLGIHSNEWHRRNDGTRTQLEISIPFEGSKELFNYQPSQHTHTHPKAIVFESHVVILCQITDSATQFKLDVNNQIDHINEWVSWVNIDVQSYTTNTTNRAYALLAGVKQDIIKRREFLNEIGIPKK